MVHGRVLAIRGLIGLTIVLGSHAQAIAHERCTAALYERAESSLAGARGSWTSLLKHQQAFASCDDGALAEGYFDAVATNFAAKWDQFGLFVGLSKRHPGFRRWAIRHIDATATDEQLKRIMLNAAACSDEGKALCEAIHQGAADALMEQKQLLHE